MNYLISQIKNLLKGVIKFSNIDIDSIDDVNDLTICLGLDKKIVKKDKYVLHQKMEMVLVDYIYQNKLI